MIHVLFYMYIGFNVGMIILGVGLFDVLEIGEGFKVKHLIMVILLPASIISIIIWKLINKIDVKKMNKILDKPVEINFRKILKM